MQTMCILSAFGDMFHMYISTHMTMCACDKVGVGVKGVSWRNASTS